MLGRIVDYLHNAYVPFRLASYPSEEALPLAAHPVPPGGMAVDARLYFVDGRLVLAAFPLGETVDPAAMSATLGGRVVVPATADELPDEFRRVEGPVPPLGQLFGIPLV